MPRPCSICVHENRKDIDRAIANCETYRNIAKRYGVSITSISRHVDKGHIAKKIQKAKELKEEKEALSFDDFVNELNEKDRAAFLASHGSGTPKEKAEATKTRVVTLTLLGKKLGELVEKKEITGANGGPVEHAVEINIVEKLKKYEHLFRRD